MKDIYLYGLSDDCHEAQVFYDHGTYELFESYGVMFIGNVIARYEFGGSPDWKITLEGDIPESWTVRQPMDAGFIHLRVPDDVVVREPNEDEADL